MKLFVSCLLGDGHRHKREQFETILEAMDFRLSPSGTTWELDCPDGEIDAFKASLADGISSFMTGFDVPESSFTVFISGNGDEIVLGSRTLTARRPQSHA